jgi:homoaconitase/3-isopropylmalate dehydratase large subunit
MGHKTAGVYLASPAMAAAAAVLGHVPSPDEVEELMREPATA